MMLLSLVCLLRCLSRGITTLHLCVCMYVCVSVHVLSMYLYVYVYVHVLVYVYVHVYVSVRVYVCVSVCLCLCVKISTGDQNNKLQRRERAVRQGATAAVASGSAQAGSESLESERCLLF